MLVRFLETVIYETEGPGKGPRFEAGSVHDLREDIAQRWLKRSKAEPVADDDAPASPESKKGRAKLGLAGQGD